MTLSPQASLRFASRRFFGSVATYLSVLGLTLLGTLFWQSAAAQTTVNSSTTQLPSGAGGGGGSATSRWGASGGGSPSASSSLSDSANAHASLGQSAALVNSAKRGFLYSSGTSIILESIGSQSIVNTSIYGDNNVADINANQTSTNNGNVSAVGSISLSGNASASTGTPATTGTGTAGKAGTPASGSCTAGASQSCVSPSATTTPVGNTTNSSTNIGVPPASGGP